METISKLPEDTENRILEIRQDHESGATRLVLAAAETVKRLCDDNGVSDKVFPSALKEAARRLVSAQPSMAAMFSLANSMLLEAESATQPEQTRKRVRQTCEAFIANNEDAEVSLHKKAAGIIRDGDTVLTHSYSSAVLKSLLQAKAAGKNVEVICTEARPRREGVLLAQELGKAKIPTRLIPDACAGLFMPEADLVFMGADAIFEGGIVNKAGTSLIALSAQAHGVDLYALATTTKFFSSALALPAQDAREPSEILAETHFNVKPVNYYFDITPMKYCTGIATENGIMKPEKVIQKLHAIRVHPALQQLLQREGAER